MGNCISEWRAKLRQERRDETEAVLNKLIAIPQRRAAARQETLRVNRRDVQDKLEEIDAIVRNKALSDAKKRDMLIEPTRLLINFREITSVSEHNWAESLRHVTLAQRMKAVNEGNDDLVDMQELLKQVPGLNSNALQKAIDKREEWVEDMRAVLETDVDEQTPSLSEATDSELGQEINKLLGAPSAQHSVQKPATAVAATTKPVRGGGKSLVSLTLA